MNFKGSKGAQAQARERRQGYRRAVDHEAVEAEAKVANVIDECLAEIACARERMNQDDVEIERLKADNRSVMAETRAILARLQVS